MARGVLVVIPVFVVAVQAPVTLAQCKQALFTAHDAEANDDFGAAVAIDDLVAMVGATSDDDACPLDPNCNSGAVYVFEFDEIKWIQRCKLPLQIQLPRTVSVWR